MNLITAYLVISAGTGSDHQLSKWSAKACEEHAGLGKPRAKHAIEELIRHEMLERTAASTRLSPQYRLPPVPIDEDPIFLPVQLITGLARETPLLRRVRETGDPLALEMLIDLYGLAQLDATYGVPIKNLRQTVLSGPSAHKLCEVGVHALWALPSHTGTRAAGQWTGKHVVQAKTEDARWEPLWERLKLLEKIGAIWWEPWVFDGPDPLAEPLLPVDPGVLYGANSDDPEAALTRLMYEAATLLASGREYLLDRYSADILLPLPLHRQPPALQGVARLRVEPDTPGRRLSYAKRMGLIEAGAAALQQLIGDTGTGRFDRPMRLAPAQEAG